ncbi:MAG TPA: 2-dehydropantoate 2-reductase N-terminal domain-containing protein, partial [Anaerolineales bacterium]|nr:2-dehydropantoate 2-reductase N-terminal domain-containing protein [Anaerolineales bacterium]
MVFGAGAVGGLVGGALDAAGERVTFLVRPSAAEHI